MSNPEEWDPRDIMGCIQDSTEYFMHAAGQLEERGFDEELRQVRRAMLFGGKGEITEFQEADLHDDLVEYIDGALDCMVVLWGTVLKAIGPLTAQKCAAEVNRSNLDKVSGDIVWSGEPGKSKVLKPEGWQGPKIREILEADGWELDEHGRVTKEGNCT